MNATQIKDELAKLAIQQDALSKRYYAIFFGRPSKQRTIELARTVREMNKTRARIAELEAMQKEAKRRT